MPEALSWAVIKQQVHERAGGCCEYCQTCEDNTGQTMQVDHIDPDGNNVLENLCLACWNCNNHKLKTTLVKDMASGDVVLPYNPRIQRWTDHFEWIEDATLVHGLTPIGRATMMRLKMNRPALVIARRRWAEGGYHPPKI